MSLSLYNVLSHLMPGYLLYLAIIHFFNIDAKYFDPIVATAIAYIIGYFVNSVSAWVEWVLNWSWRGRPSEQLLKGKKCGRIEFAEHEKMVKIFQEKIGKDNVKIDDMFQIAMRVADNDGRISDMNGQYAFSRSILVAVIISSTILSFKYYCINWFWILSIMVILIFWYRTKERGFYYAKEVLTVALNKLNQK